MPGPQLCRLCAESKRNLIGIYDAEGQKLAIEAKISNFLQIQVLSTDCLPLSVCKECYARLNECNKFHEMANQAQTSLQQMLISKKPEKNPSDTQIDYTNNRTEFLKEEHLIEEIVHCYSSSPDYPGDPEIMNKSNVTFTPNINMNKSSIITDSSYINQKINSKKFSVINVIKGEDDELEGYKVTEKKNPSKRSKKKIRKCNQDAKKEDLESRLTSELDDDDVYKGNLKIPDNYMIGSASDVEAIEAQAEKDLKPGRKRGKGFDRHPWLCTDCNDKLPSFEALQNHHNVIHNQKAKYMCVKCCKIYDKYYGFLIHVRRHKTKPKFNCEECGKLFVHKKVLESHKAIHSENRQFVCQTCGKSFRQQSALYIHSRCHLPENMKNQYQCDQCDKRFSTKPNLVTHKRIHSGVRNFTCDQCGKSFIQKGNLEAHFLTHSADKPYNCDKCPKAFKTPLQLKKHETVHTGAKPHECTVCGRTFREKGTLREHNRIHTGAMPFTCEFCGKCFRFKGILTTHRRQHTGERPYSCLECQHHFTNWPNYNKHMKRRHGINTSHVKYHQQALQQKIKIEQDHETDQKEATNLSHVSISQPIIVQALPTTTIQSFQPEFSDIVQEAEFHESNTTYLNTVSTVSQNFITPYTFYSISNVTDNDSIQHRQNN